MIRQLLDRLLIERNDRLGRGVRRVLEEIRWWRVYVVNPWCRNKRERVLMWTAWHLPKSLAYWTTIRVMAHATTGEYDSTNPTTLSAMDILRRWESGK